MVSTGGVLHHQRGDRIIINLILLFNQLFNLDRSSYYTYYSYITYTGKHCEPLMDVIQMMMMMMMLILRM